MDLGTSSKMRGHPWIMCACCMHAGVNMNTCITFVRPHTGHNATTVQEDRHTHTHLHSVNDMSRATGSVRAAFFLLLSLSASPPSTLRGFVQPRCAHTWLPSPSSHPVLSFPLSFLCCFAAGHTSASAVTRHMARATGSGAREYGEGRILFTTPGWLPVALSRRADPNSFSHMRRTLFFPP